MQFIEWSKEYETGIYDIDQQHHSLFALVNDLHKIATETYQPEPIQEAIMALMDYVKYHFRNEEQLLEDANYRKLETHRAEHRALEAKVEFYQKSFEGDPLAFDLVDFLSFLNSWLKNHILHSDMEYLPSLNARQR